MKIGESDVSVLATPTSARWTASNDEDTPSTGPINAAMASCLKAVGFSLSALKVLPTYFWKAVKIQSARAAANMRMALPWNGEKSPYMPCLEKTKPVA